MSVIKIPFLNLKHQNDTIRSELASSFEQFLDDSYFVLGNGVREFEAEFSKYVGSAHGVGVASGLDAMILTLDAIGVTQGDEVIVPSNTYIATWLAVSRLGAVPVPVEPRIETYNLNPDLIEEKISKRTRAILPVHLYGQACEMDAILEIAERHDLFVLEDNAQAQGACWRDHKTGGLGHAGATSFYPGKNLGAFGDAGIINCNNVELATKLRSLRNYGSQKKYFNDVLGYNSRLDELQARLLKVKLKHLDQWNKEREQIAAVYNGQLSGIEDLVLPELASGATTVYHIYLVRTQRRDELQNYLREQGIGTLIHYPLPPHLQKAYAFLNYERGSFPIAEEIADTCLSLPIYPGLEEKVIHYICEKIKQFYSSRIIGR